MTGQGRGQGGVRSRSSIRIVCVYNDKYMVRKVCIF